MWPELLPLSAQFQQKFTQEWTQLPLQLLAEAPNLRAIHTSIEWNPLNVNVVKKDENPAKYGEIRGKLISALGQVKMAIINKLASFDFREKQ